MFLRSLYTTIIRAINKYTDTKLKVYLSLIIKKNKNPSTKKSFFQ